MNERGPRRARHSSLPALLRRFLRDWLRFRSAAALSPFTLKNDRTSIERFILWIETKKPELRDLGAVAEREVEDYALWLALYEGEDGGRLTVHTRYRQLVNLRTFFAWLEKRGKVLRSPARDLVLPKLPEKLPRGVLTTAEVERVLAVPDRKTAIGLRDRAVLEVLYSSALRNRELRELRLEDLNLAEGYVTVRRGKGGRGRVVPIGKPATRSLRRYLEEGRAKLGPPRFERTVFLTRAGTPLLSQLLERLVARNAKLARLGKPLTPHALRHTCATDLLKGGADIRHVQELLGHKRLSSTQVYTRVTPSDLKKVHARCHPREREP